MQEKYLKEYLAFVVASISTNLVTSLSGVKNGKKVNVDIFKGGVYKCKLDYIFNSQAKAIVNAYGIERLNQYLDKYGIVLSDDDMVSKVITEEELKESFEEAKVYSKEMVSKLNPKDGYVWRSFRDDRHIYLVQNEMKDALQNGELTKESVDKILIGEATKEIQTYIIDAPNLAMEEYLNYLVGLIEEGKDFAQDVIYYVHYHDVHSNKGSYYDRVTPTPSKDYNSHYSKLRSRGVSIDRFIEYAKEHGYSVTISDHPQERYILISRVKDNKQNYDSFLQVKQSEELRNREKLYQKLNSLVDEKSVDINSSTVAFDDNDYQSGGRGL